MIDFLNIGLDFGTHQSKVCIEDTADPRNRIYSFFKFSRPDGTKSFFLPSIVQINKDRTLSYGFVDESNALILGEKHTFSEPQLAMPQLPKLYKIPPKPVINKPRTEEDYIATLGKKKRFQTIVKVTKGPNGKKVITTFKQDVGKEKYQKYLADFKAKRRLEQLKWEQEYGTKESYNAFLMRKYEEDCEDAKQQYLKKRSYWESSITEKKAVYKFFKICTFSKDYRWDGDISPKLISTWYLTYVLFCIFEEYPDEVPFQMGIPESIGDSFAVIQRKMAEDIFYTAYRLYKLFVSKDVFLNSSVDYLKSVTDFKSYSIDYSKGSQVLVLPEAFAGLLSITQQGKIGRGMTLLVDIGGGSTDISLFNVVNNRSETIPNISYVISLHHGLNYIYGLYQKTHYEMDIDAIRELFEKDPLALKAEIEDYWKELASLIDNEIYHPLRIAALKQGISQERLMPIIMDRPVIISGGGGVYKIFHKGLHLFREPVSVSKDLLSLKNVTDKRITDDELSILSVAYGLSIPQVREPIMTPLNQLFRDIRIRKENSSSAREYEHLLSDT